MGRTKDRFSVAADKLATTSAYIHGTAFDISNNRNHGMPYAVTQSTGAFAPAFEFRSRSGQRIGCHGRRRIKLVAADVAQIDGDLCGGRQAGRALHINAGWRRGRNIGDFERVVRDLTVPKAPSAVPLSQRGSAISTGTASRPRRRRRRAARSG